MPIAHPPRRWALIRLHIDQVVEQRHYMDHRLLVRVNAADGAHRRLEGILTVRGASEAKRIVVVGGFAEVNEQGLTVLADMAMPVEDFDRASLATQIKDTEEDVADATEDAERDAAREKLEQLKALDAALAQ